MAVDGGKCSNCGSEKNTYTEENLNPMELMRDDYKLIRVKCSMCGKRWVNVHDERPPEYFKEEKSYYLQNTQGGAYVGNSLKWWAINNKGYTCDIRCARVWTQEEMEEESKDLRSCDKFWPRDVIEPLAQHHIDHQDLRKDNNGNYRKDPHTLMTWRKDLCKE